MKIDYLNFAVFGAPPGFFSQLLYFFSIFFGHLKVAFA